MHDNSSSSGDQLKPPQTLQTNKPIDLDGILTRADQQGRPYLRRVIHQIGVLTNPNIAGGDPGIVNENKPEAATFIASLDHYGFGSEEMPEYIAKVINKYLAATRFRDDRSWHETVRRTTSVADHVKVLQSSLQEQNVRPENPNSPLVLDTCIMASLAVGDIDGVVALIRGADTFTKTASPSRDTLSRVNGVLNSATTDVYVPEMAQNLNLKIAGLRGELGITR